MDNDEFKALLELANFKMEARKERRQHEWRVSLGVWTALAAGMATFKTIQEDNLKILLMVVILMHVLWVKWNFDRNERDAKIAYEFLKKAETFVGTDLLKIKTNSGGFFTDIPPLFQIVATIILCVGWIVVVRQASKIVLGSP